MRKEGKLGDSYINHGSVRFGNYWDETRSGGACLCMTFSNMLLATQSTLVCFGISFCLLLVRQAWVWAKSIRKRTASGNISGKAHSSEHTIQDEGSSSKPDSKSSARPSTARHVDHQELELYKTLYFKVRILEPIKKSCHRRIRH